MSKKRTTVTYNDAEKYVKLIEARWGKECFDIYGPPRIVKGWDGRGNVSIIWEGPYEWTYYSTIESFAYVERDTEYGLRLPIVPVPDSLSHVFSEPNNACVLTLYSEG